MKYFNMYCMYFVIRKNNGKLQPTDQGKESVNNEDEVSYNKHIKTHKRLIHKHNTFKKS